MINLKDQTTVLETCVVSQGVDMSKSVPNNTNRWIQVFLVYESDSPNQGSQRGYNPENGIKVGKSTDFGIEEQEMNLYGHEGRDASRGRRRSWFCSDRCHRPAPSLAFLQPAHVPVHIHLCPAHEVQAQMTPYVRT